MNASRNYKHSRQRMDIVMYQIPRRMMLNFTLLVSGVIISGRSIEAINQDANFFLVR